MTEGRTLCECGCGKYALSGNRFINGHNSRGIKQSQTHITKKLKAQKEYYRKNPKEREEVTKRLLDMSKEYWKDQKNRDGKSKTLKQFYVDNPEAREAARSKTIEQFSSQESRDAQSDRIKNSEDAKIARETKSENMRGGNDIIKHHVAYDFLRHDVLTVGITRKFHSQIHHPKGCKFEDRGYSLID